MNTATLNETTVDLELLERRTVLPGAFELDVVMAAVAATEGVIGSVLGRAGQGSLVDDVLSETRIALWRRLVCETPTVEIRDLRAYTVTVALNHARSALRRAGRELTAGLDCEDVAGLQDRVHTSQDPSGSGADDAIRWARYVRDEVGVKVWERFTSLAADEDVTLMQLRAQMPGSRWVRQVASTAKAAMRLAVDVRDASRQQIWEACLPSRLSAALTSTEDDARTSRYRRDAHRLSSFAQWVYSAEVMPWL